MFNINRSFIFIVLWGILIKVYMYYYDITSTYSASTGTIYERMNYQVIIRVNFDIIKLAYIAIVLGLLHILSKKV